MKILITNDDGVYAPGIRYLKEELEKYFEVYVVAPTQERSTTGHTLSLDHPLRITEIDKNVIACSGYPADCTLMGIGHFFKEARPDLIISGINRGANLGQDIYYSGTVAAAREGVFHGVPAIAISSAMDFTAKAHNFEYFKPAAKFAVDLVKENIHKILDPLTVLNINVPELMKDEIKGIKLTDLGFRKYSEDIQERFDFRDRPYFWLGGIYRGFMEIENSDCSAVDEGFISFCPLNLLGKSADNHSKWTEFIQKLSDWND